MKLHRLELEGFGPYRERQSVDFDAFADDGIFLIAGRTGAGKSSILDGVCFALYGQVPRYDGGEKRLRSDHCAPDDATEVVLEFTVAGARWRATRAPEYERPKRRGDGTTVEAARAQLDELIDGCWQGRAAGPRDVALALDEILGLNQQQFLQVILLAQNRFQRFLLARNDERQALLRTLFGTRTYEEYEKTLEQRRQQAGADMAAAAGRIALHLADAEDLIAEHGLGPADGILPTTPDERIAAAERAAQRAAYRAETAVTERDAAERAHDAAAAAHAAASVLVEKQQQRDRARTTLDGLLAVQDSIAADRGVLDDAARAEALRAPIEAAERAARSASTAAAVADSARAAWIAAGEDDADPAELAVLVERLAGELAVARAAGEQERELAVARSDAATAAERSADLERLLADLEERSAAIPPELQRVEAAFADAAAGAAGLEHAREDRDRFGAALVAARDAEELAGLVRAAERSHADRSGDLERAVAAVTDLLRRRLTGYAGELAAGLIDGEACAVCGSTSHPRPAEHHDDPVTDAMLTDAERARDVAGAAEREASDAARASRAAYADAAARSGGAAVIQLERESAKALREVAAAEEATRTRDALAVQREQLEALRQLADAERAGLGASIASAREQLAVAASRVQILGRDVDAALVGFPTVAERVAALQLRRQLPRAFVAALGDHAVRADAGREACADRDARVAASAFPDASSATDALRDDGVRAALQARIRAHETALHAERERLRELELELAGTEESLDVEASAAAVDDARTRWDAAVTTAASATAAVARLRRIIERAVAARDDVAELADEHAAVTRLADTVAGRAPNTHRMTLETFVLAAELEEIVTAANIRLNDMSSGRYRLQHTDARAARNAASGLGIEVLDAYTGQARPAQSLSGGETFLASLALALGLAEVVTGRAGGLRLDTLFIDEGFGTLDAETLDLAMATLDELRQGGRTVGVISHVEAMKEQLAAQLVVEATASGSSVIRHSVAALV